MFKYIVSIRYVYNLFSLVSEDIFSAIRVLRGR